MDRELNKKIIAKWCERIKKNNKEIYYEPNEGQKYTRFIKKDITEMLFKNNGSRGSYGEHKIIYEIQNEINSIRLNCVIGSKGLSDKEKEQCNKIIEKFIVNRKVKENWKYAIVKSWNVCKEASMNTIDTVKYIEGNLTSILEGEIPMLEGEIRNILEGVRNINCKEGELFEIGEVEGKEIPVYMTRYERSKRNREDAIKIHGTKCLCCGFDFELAYGELGKGFIEVHHKNPVSNLEKEQVVDPIKDLVCLCSNCHSMVHRDRKNIISVEELKAMYKCEE